MKKIYLLLLLLPMTVVAQNAQKLQKKVDRGDANAMYELATYYMIGHEVDVDTVKAMDLMRQAMAKGNLAAQARLSRYVLEHDHDTAGALSLLNDALAKQSPDAMRVHANFMQDGVMGNPRMYGYAQQRLEEALTKGCKYAAADLAWMYLYGGDSCDYDPEKSFSYIKQIPEGVGSNKYAMMSQYYLQKGDYSKARSWAEKGVAHGDMNARMQVVWLKFYGLGYEEDERGALAEMMNIYSKYGQRPELMRMEVIMRRSSENPEVRNNDLCRSLMMRLVEYPHVNGYDILGQSYMFGNFTEQDSAKAYQYWLVGARNEEPESMMQLAILHLNWGNYDSVHYYNDRAVALGLAEASNLYSRIYSFGAFGGDPDYAAALPYACESARLGNIADYVEAGRFCLWTADTVRAVKCFEKAIAFDYVDAYANLAYLEADRGNPKWIRLLEQGAKKGSSLCCNRLGDYYSNQEDYNKAADCYRRASNPEGDYELGRLYLYGAVGKQSESDIRQGAALMRRAAMAEYSDAVYMMARLFDSGVGVDQSYDSAYSMLNYLAQNNDPNGLLGVAVYTESGLAVPTDSVAALRYYEQAGAAGSAMGYTFAADYYLKGLGGITPDTAKALQYFRLGADMQEGSATACYRLAQCCLQGVGGSPDSVAAVPLLRRAVAGGSHEAAAELADFYNYGLAGVPINGDTALYLYHFASEGDVPRGDYMMGAYLYEQGSYDKAVGYLTSAMNNGSVDAAVLMAQAMLVGNGVEQNPAAAVDMLHSLAPRDSKGQAYYMLGIAHFLGSGAEFDQQQAILYFDTAASMGHTRAMTTLAQLYASGDGAPRDTSLALLYLQRAVSAGSTQAMLQLANSYKQGILVPKDAKRAAELYQRAADRGNLEALCRLGLCYEEGEGVVLNSRKAFNLYTQAAESGSAYGMRLLAYCYAQGIYVKEDLAQAAEWFLRSAEAGDLNSCYIIGQMYAQGEGVKKDKKQAKHWLTIAANNGMEAAVQALREL